MINLPIFLCILLWGFTTFLNRLAVERMPATLLQAIIGIVYIIYIPIAIKMSGIGINYKWSIYSIILTTIAAVLSIGSNIILYNYLKGNINSGSSVMLISLYPTIALLLSVLFLGEHLSFIKIIGVIIMIVGAILLSLK